MNNSFKYVVAMAVIAIASITISGCASKKNTVGVNGKSVVADKGDDNQVQALAFVQKVAGRRVDTNNIVGKMTMTVKMGSKEITVPGSLRMRYNEVIRLQAFIPLLGSEVGRIEFTPDYVLVVDRMHKEYIKADYNTIDFLRNTGLNYYSLQALFWNRLFVPGKQEVDAAGLMDFKVADMSSADSRKLSFSKGNMELSWTADAANGRISVAEVTYRSVTHGNSLLHWDYSKFKNVGDWVFPACQSFSFTSKAIKGGGATSLTIDMDNIKNDDKWEAQTSVSSKYKKVDATDIFEKLFSR